MVKKYVVVRYGGYGWSDAGDAGIRCVGASPKISQCVISNIGGDGIYCQNKATPIIHYCWIYDNTGYGVRNVDASVTVGRCFGAVPRGPQPRRQRERRER